MKTSIRNNLRVQAVLAGLLSAASAPAESHYVAMTGSDINPGTQALPFRTIQKGIDAAQEGDSVLVANGIYTGIGNRDLNFNGKNLTLQSAGGAENCIIDCGGTSSRGIRFRNGETAEAIVDGFTIRNGYVLSGGSGIYILDSSPTIVRCRIENNGPSGGFGNGGGMSLTNSNARIVACTFVGNTAERGGAISLRDSSPTITNCGFTSNSGRVNTSVLRHCYGGAIDIIRGNPTMSHCAFVGNTTNAAGTATGFGGGIATDDCGLTMSHCILITNTGPEAGGIYAAGSTLTVNNCRFFTNQSLSSQSGFGGGISQRGGLILITNALFDGNQAAVNGGAVSVRPSAGGVPASATILHTTFAANQALGGGALAVVGSSVNATSSVLWSNIGAEVLAGSQGFIGVTYSDVQGGFPGVGNINANPLFVDPLSGNFRIQEGSPCFDAALNNAPGLPPIDLDGGPRVLRAAPDMGAYEAWFPSFGDWYVDDAIGHDTNSGSPIAPFRTVTRAVTTASNGQTIHIRQGAYGDDVLRITKAVRLINWGNTGLARVGQP